MKYVKDHIMIDVRGLINWLRGISTENLKKYFE